MKVNFSIVRPQVSPVRFSLRQTGELPRLPDTSPTAPGASERGVALIVTLIMLSVITFMTVTFLVLSQRERGSVTTSTDQLIAKQAAESGSERAKIEMLAPMLAMTNDQVAEMIVSTNFINNAGFDPGSPVNRFTNVNFDYRLDHNPLTPSERLQMLANLFYNPRPPVYVTNRSGGTEFRYYLDLNRNGFYDTNGFTPEMGMNGLPIVVGGVTNYGWHVGDPEWIGVLERPEMPHSSSNKFIARYAYVVVPAGKTLDVNYIHNQAFTRNLTLVNDGFMRNQGVGTWEINLAAFLADLNTNQWYRGTFKYQRPGLANSGLAFEDAQSILRYRYAGNYNNLLPASQMFFNNALSLENDGSDEYSDGPLMTGTQINESPTKDQVNEPWAGADNPNHLFTIQDMFDPAKVSIPLVSRMLQAGTNVSSYDRYTYYRMLSQLGTGSGPDRRLNVNYVNIDSQGRVMPGMETNQIAWTPEQFFTNAADRLLRQNTREWSRNDEYSFTNTFGLTNAFGLTNIPVFYSYINSAGGTNQYFGYTPSVHRLLQLSANIFDASAGNEGANLIVLPPSGGGTKTLYAPHVFRPIFRRETNNMAVYVVGYRELTDTAFVNPATAPRMVDLHDIKDRENNIPILSVPINSNLRFEPMAYGIPVVIGAKKGFPNFNKFALQNAVTATRKLNFRRVAGHPVSQTNQVYSFQITNAFGVQVWNSYNVDFPRDVQIRATANLTLFVTNELGMILGPYNGTFSNRYVVGPLFTNITAGKWKAFVASPPSAVSFVVPMLTNYLFLTNSDYVQTSAAGGVFQKPGYWDTANVFRIPKLWLNVRAQVQVAIIDTAATPNRILDYVNLDSSEAPINIVDAMRGDTARCDGADISDGGDFWCTNRVDNPLGLPVVDNPALPTYGMINQIRASLGDPSVSEAMWRKYSPATGDKDKAIGTFTEKFYDDTGTVEGSTDFGAPFQPTRTFYQYVRWEANDPLVHYTASDLADSLVQAVKIDLDLASHSPVRRLTSPNALNDHYLPWGGNPVNPAETSPMTQYNPGVKDPGMVNSDRWDFPTNKLPNIGWLGRVHRGTPWQTVYLKSDDLGTRLYGSAFTNWTGLAAVSSNTWVKWSGNLSYLGADAFHSRPVQDRMLFDTFTAALNDNSSRGRLSVNQSGLAAWSAVLSGVTVITNSGSSLTIDPAAVSPAVARIVNGINRTRAATTVTNAGRYEFVFPRAEFAHIGDVLATPELTFGSPYINTNNLPSLGANGLNDEFLERIPQQIMSLLDLDHSARLVIYSYGQTLKPANQSIIRAFGPYRGMCTNYQVTAETATRTVLRVDGSFDPRDSNNSDPLLHYPPRVVVEQYNLLPPD